MFGETVNNIIGRTVNPYNRLLACGGSSGGEGALLALHGSSVGVGTDLAGSIRIPASPSNLSTHCASDLVYFMQAVLQQEPWRYDPKSIDISWRETRYLEGKTGKKVFGVIAADG
ncbi:unnamed protein product [Rotaria sp. Silwood1]|nr:unnamed protein product [Rotaria sp. Silwood1]